MVRAGAAGRAGGDGARRGTARHGGGVKAAQRAPLPRTEGAVGARPAWAPAACPGGAGRR